MPTNRPFTVANNSGVRLVVSGGTNTNSPQTVPIGGSVSGTVDDATPATISVHPQDVEGLAGGHGEEG